jgi:hypothetical protein
VWVIQTNKSIVEQNREHAEIYLDKVTILQSKFIALHVGLFWGIGRFIIKNEDRITIKTTDKIIFDNLSSNEESSDEFIKNKIFFIKQLIEQRKLKIKYEFIDVAENLSSKLL